MSVAHRWSKFWWQDWRGEPALRMCSLAARGAWMELLCIAFEADGYVMVGGQKPSLEMLARMLGVGKKDLEKLICELRESGVFSETEDGVIYSRRMVRDIAIRKRAVDNGSNGGNPEILRGTVEKDERVRPFRRTDAPAKTDRIFEATGGRCHWCGVALQRSNPNVLDFFHVDHVVAVRDGGTNDESNLVASCADCNYKRARGITPTPRDGLVSESDPTPRVPDSDTNLQDARSEKLEAENPPLKGPPPLVGSALSDPSSPLRQAIDRWNAMAERSGLARVRVESPQRLKRLADRVAEVGLDGIVEAIDRIDKSAFCHGANERGWLADFDFLLQRDSLCRTLEGRYDDRASRAPERPMRNGFCELLASLEGRDADAIH